MENGSIKIEGHGEGVNQFQKKERTTNYVESTTSCTVTQVNLKLMYDEYVGNYLCLFHRSTSNDVDLAM